MTKLSEFKGQEHITAPLRAMVINHEPARQIAIVGDEDLALDIFEAFSKSLNCERPVRGNACGECDTCRQGPSWLSDRTVWLPGQWIQQSDIYGIVTSFTESEGFLTFHVNTTPGTKFSSELLELFVLSNLSDKKQLYAVAQKYAKTVGYPEFLTEYLSLFKTLLYIKQNVEVEIGHKSDLVRQLAMKVPLRAIHSALNCLWDAQTKTTLPDALAVEVVCALVSEALAPSPVDYAFETGDLPISSVENITELPLSFERLLEIARE